MHQGQVSGQQSQMAIEQGQIHHQVPQQQDKTSQQQGQIPLQPNQQQTFTQQDQQQGQLAQLGWRVQQQTFLVTMPLGSLDYSATYVFVAMVL